MGMGADELELAFYSTPVTQTPNSPLRTPLSRPGEARIAESWCVVSGDVAQWPVWGQVGGRGVG